RTICIALTRQASIATRATLRDDRASSLVAARAEAVDTANQNSGKEKYFRSGGLTAFAGDLPVVPKMSQPGLRAAQTSSHSLRTPALADS
ncbi:hypothetical protein, partial [Escherichia coli]|uniref:hypothetical protein n=1 Tax=Escherichia coli TaxID=562 RepID=UPI001BE48E43